MSCRVSAHRARSHGQFFISLEDMRHGLTPATEAQNNTWEIETAHAAKQSRTYKHAQ